MWAVEMCGSGCNLGLGICSDSWGSALEKVGMAGREVFLLLLF